MFISAQLEILYIGIYLMVVVFLSTKDIGRAREIHGMTRTQTGIRTAAATICGTATFVATGMLANFTAHVLGTPIEFNGITIGTARNPVIQLPGYTISILAVIWVHRWAGRRLISPDNAPDSRADPQHHNVPPAS